MKPFTLSQSDPVENLFAGIEQAGGQKDVTSYQMALLAKVLEGLDVDHQIYLLVSQGAQGTLKNLLDKDIAKDFAISSVDIFSQSVGGVYEALVAYESGMLIEPNMLFGKARQLLVEGGKLSIAGMVDVQEGRIRGAPNNAQGNIRRHAGRAGFEQIAETDYTASVLEFYNDWLSMTESQGAKNDTSRKLLTLVGELKNRIQQLKGGYAWKHIVFRFNNQDLGAFIRPYREGDEVEINRLFKEVFEKDYTKIWQWKHRYKGSKPTAMLAFRRGRLIAQYTGIPRSFILQGKNITAVQMCDIMVDKQARGQWKKDGPFAATSKTYIETYIGEELKFPYAYGFPNERHLKLGIRLGIYEEACKFLSFKAKPKKSRKAWLFKIESLDNAEQIANMVSRLWPLMRDSFQGELLGVRNMDYVTWRYLEHPQEKYQYWVLKSLFRRKPIGLAIVRIDGRRARVLDFITKKSKISVFAGIILDYCLKGNIADTVEIYITQYFSDFFSKIGYRADSTGISIPNDPGPKVKEYGKHLFLMLGDSDLA